MSQYRASFSFEGIVIQKTKLKESDLIITLLTTEGALLPLVAKGARKPHNSFAARMELGNWVRGLAFGKTKLSIVKEVSLKRAFMGSRTDIASLYALSTLCEGAVKLCKESPEDSRYFQCLSAALIQLEHVKSTWESGLLACAYMAKMFALIGVRPQLRSCIHCSTLLVAQEEYTMKDRHEQKGCGQKEEPYLGLIAANVPYQRREFFSLEEGGLICRDCACEYYDQNSLKSRLIRNCMLFDLLISLSFEESRGCAAQIRTSGVTLEPLIDFIEEYSSFQGFGRIKSLASFVHILKSTESC